MGGVAFARVASYARQARVGSLGTEVSLGDGGNSVCALLSSGTVECCRPPLERIPDKTGARHRAEPVRYAIQAGVEPVAFTA